MSQIVQFEPFSSTIEPEFWAGLAHHKLHSARLDTARAGIRGEFVGGRRHAVRGSTAGEVVQRVAVPARLRVSQGIWSGSDDSSSGGNGGDDNGASAQPSGVTVTGHLYNTNTIEEFKKYDKGELLRGVGAEILEDISSGRATTAPELLWPFVLLSFSDLKKYHFYHWFGFPAVTADPPDTYETMTPLSSHVGSETDLDALRVAYADYAASIHGAFLVRYQPSTSRVWQLYSLAEWDAAFAEAGEGEHAETMLAFIDPSSHASRLGWPLRNLLTWVRHTHAETRRVRVLCFRDAALCAASSSAQQQSKIDPSAFESIVVDINVTAVADLKSATSVSGWERNERDKLAPRMVNLSSTMDPVRLAESALDLNLQLMRWRLAPSIDLAKIAGTRALLVGAGTLGAYAARALLAWGVRKITFIDNGRVSFSNPPRQPLYEFEDTLGGGKPKAEAAAEAMRRIFPNVDAQGVQMSIPMPGHAVSPAELDSTRLTVEKLDGLVQEHDVVFLLTDSRESRWLPTMLGTLHRKIVICVALGFDSYVAMRHGVYPDADDVSRSRLGCYFCNDVVAPTDSLTDRTLDQQCTVTRPGLAPIASGTAVELLTTILQHPLGGLAPAPASGSNLESLSDAPEQEGVFGVPDHQIRGYLVGFRQHAIVGQSSDMCTACSPKIIAAYREHGFEFLLRAFNNTLVAEDMPHVPIAVEDGAANVPEGYSYLETLTGLAALHRQTDDIMADIEWSDAEDADAAAGDTDDDFEAV
ncbi:Autophagy protein 7 [Coemansia erecta]|uniref:Ubiquitin-like modifier-activating enzyme ATG7 n=1 Tax=Coemansia erecta TaxID=147472 RepID=A0A9W8CS21_9FUNG|nr:Autophagy protein 7 [Coemansia erecta]